MGEAPLLEAPSKGLQRKEEAETQPQLASVEKVPVLPLPTLCALPPWSPPEDLAPGYLLKSNQSLTPAWVEPSPGSSVSPESLSLGAAVPGLYGTIPIFFPPPRACRTSPPQPRHLLQACVLGSAHWTSLGLCLLQAPPAEAEDAYLSLQLLRAAPAWPAVLTSLPEKEIKQECRGQPAPDAPR